MGIAIRQVATVGLKPGETGLQSESAKLGSGKCSKNMPCNSAFPPNSRDLAYLATLLPGVCAQLVNPVPWKIASHARTTTAARHARMAAVPRARQGRAPLHRF